jgi:hypothetical protein
MNNALKFNVDGKKRSVARSRSHGCGLLIVLRFRNTKGTALESRVFRFAREAKRAVRHVDK